MHLVLAVAHGAFEEWSWQPRLAPEHLVVAQGMFLAAKQLATRAQNRTRGVVCLRAQHHVRPSREHLGASTNQAHEDLTKRAGLLRA